MVLGAAAESISMDFVIVCHTIVSSRRLEAAERRILQPAGFQITNIGCFGKLAAVPFRCNTFAMHSIACATCRSTRCIVKFC